MSSTALYKALIETGASDENATRAAADVVQVSQLPQLATKMDIADTKTAIADTKAELKSDIAEVKSDIVILRSNIEILRSDMNAGLANLETRLLKWMVGCGFLFAGMVIAGVGVLIRVM